MSDKPELALVARAPIRYRVISQPTGASAEIERPGEICTVNQVVYLRRTGLAWQEAALERNGSAPMFNWVSVFNFHPDAVVLTLDIEGEAQALMMVRDSHVVRCDIGNRASLVYIGFLEVAPWNRRSADPRAASGLGPIMLRVASNLSAERGFGGRVGLHSVDTAEPFYRRLGFRSYDCPNEYNELYFELDTSAAEVLLNT